MERDRKDRVRSRFRTGRSVVAFAVAAAMAGAAWGQATGSATKDAKAANKTKAAESKAAEPKAADAAGAEKKVLYARDVQPILKESCVQCHRAPGANQRGPGAGAGGPGARRGPGGAGATGGPGGGQRGPGGGGMRGPAGGLRLDDKAAILKGGKHGKAVVPGKGEESLLYKILKETVTVGDDEIEQMPKARPGHEFAALPEEQVELIKQWIDQGAK